MPTGHRCDAGDKHAPSMANLQGEAQFSVTDTLLRMGISEFLALIHAVALG